ncbi:MAG: class I SAM-dependent methyltransferase [Gammaproteobacteria bacterium]|nr:class I SAM-dependent methyltransferase [Gammaproteobacteria bacterium]NNF60877.1 class I SAM-dependent methyltransferase [Gammaproteobacteria bacterium]
MAEALQPHSRAASWSRYWQGGHKDTCFLAGQAFSIREHWMSLFSSLPDNSRIVDLATGNGAVALLAAEAARDNGKSFDITGVDFARIQPDRVADNDPDLVSRVNFIADTPVENLPLADASQDVVVSQFGFEYSRTADTINEISRVLVPGGRVRMLIHATDGAVSKASQGRLKRARDICARGQLVDLARALQPASTADYAGARKDDKNLARFRSRLSTARKKYAAAPDDDVVHYVISYLTELVDRRLRVDPNDYRQAVANLQAEIKAYSLRLNAMTNAARSKKDMDTLVSQLQDSALVEGSFALLEDERGAIGWFLKAHRA